MAGYMYINAALNIEDDADLIDAIEQFKAKGGNLSDLIRNLLREYFFGPKIDEISDKALYRLVQIEKRQKEAFKKLEELSQFLDDLSLEIANLRKVMDQKQTKSIENADDKLIGIIKKVFEDIERDPTVLRFVDDPKRAIRARLKAIAKQTGRKLPEIEALAKEHVPVVRSVLTDNWR